jgi:hypothetical protein
MSNRKKATPPPNDDVPSRKQYAARDSMLKGLHVALVSTIGFNLSAVLLALPEQLANGEACEHLRKYFRGGVPEVREKIIAAQCGLDAVREVFASIDEMR